MRYTSAIEPTAYGLGSTISAAPAARAPTTPAPKDIEPCVSVGPSSMTTTRLPSTREGSLTVTGESASMMRARGLRPSTEAVTSSMAAASAESHLATMTTSAIRTLASPGW